MSTKTTRVYVELSLSLRDNRIPEAWEAYKTPVPDEAIEAVNAYRSLSSRRHILTFDVADNYDARRAFANALQAYAQTALGIDASIGAFAEVSKAADAAYAVIEAAKNPPDVLRDLTAEEADGLLEVDDRDPFVHAPEAA